MNKVIKEYDTYKDNFKIKIVKPVTSTMYNLEVTSGTKPKELDGRFTSLYEAERAITKYLNSVKVPRTSKNIKDGVEDKLKSQSGRKVGEE